MDWEIKLEIWQAEILWDNSAFAIEDLPSDYLGFYRAYLQDVHGEQLSVEEIISLLGPVTWSDEGPPNPRLFIRPFNGQGLRLLENRNMNFTPMVPEEICG